MFRKLFTAAVLGLAGTSAIVATGCTSNPSGKPYALTGDQASYGVNGAGEKSPLTAQERARATDQKGRFHPEWVDASGR